MELVGPAYVVTCVKASVDPTWDALVEATAGDLAQTTLWAASRQQLGLHAYRIMITTSEQEPLGGCLMYAKRVAPACSVAWIPRGPLLFRRDSSVAFAVVRTILALAQRGGIRALVIQPPEGASALEEATMTAGFRPGVPSVAPEATIRLDLSHDNDQLLKSMNEMRRRNLRKALRAGLTVYQDDDVELFHRLHVATAKRQGFIPVTHENLRAQWDLLAPRTNCAMFIARHQGEAAAGIWLTRFAGTVSVKLVGWDVSTPAPPHVSDALQWAAIQWARTNGDRTYDLGGFDRRSAECLINSQPMPHDFHGSASFYKLSFGGTAVLFPRARFLLLPKLIDFALGRAAQRLFASPVVRQVAQHLRSGRLPRLYPSLRRVAASYENIEVAGSGD
jgi:lipid II:glycine glycyltransferase (peptidoglycan interpeptide bridge formation enzyme)